MGAQGCRGLGLRADDEASRRRGQSDESGILWPLLVPVRTRLRHILECPRPRTERRRCGSLCQHNMVRCGARQSPRTATTTSAARRRQECKEGREGGTLADRGKCGVIANEGDRNGRGQRHVGDGRAPGTVKIYCRRRAERLVYDVLRYDKATRLPLPLMHL